eukprot:m.164091 g.164091  ORF g.164091 m.164091 type:complete len:838 (+) comp38865_c0_seq2:4080-6593(+)
MLAPFNDWMSRFVKLADIPWTEGASFNRFSHPWYDYLQHPTVKKKIDGFSRFRADSMELKFLINGAPTQYGLILCSYKPMINATADVSGGNTSAVAGSGAYMMTHTCYPHVFLSPSTSSGATMKIPFMCPQNYIQLKDENDPLVQAIDLGTLFMDSFGNLNTVSDPAAPITIALYARPVNFSMWGPTAYEVQSDEYSVHPVSTTASRVSAVASVLSRIPYIGPYMMATEIGAGALASVARMFGYSNPPVIEPVSVVMTRNMYGLSTPSVPVQLDKQALDPKNELCVDPRTVGIAPTDDMVISNVLDRNVYIGESVWYSSDASESPLLAMYVTPEMLFAGTIGSGTLTTALGATAVNMTPSCHLAQLFKYWRGSISYTFTIIASQFHRGRYMLEYEPVVGGAFPVSSGTNGNLRQWVVDIKDSPSFTLDIDMCAPTSWLPTARTAFNGFSGNEFLSARTSNPGFLGLSGANGVIRMRALTDLASTAASTEVTVLVRMNCAKVEFACPVDLSHSPTTYITQSDETELVPDVITETNADTSVETTSPGQDYSIYQGEAVRSLRTLLQRANFYQSLVLFPMVSKSAATNDRLGLNYSGAYNSLWSTMTVKWILPRIGTQVGSVFKSGSTTKWWTTSVIGGGDSGVVAGRPTILAYLLPCYVGYRGSVGYRITYGANKTSTPISIAGMSVNRETVESMGSMAVKGQYGTAYGHDLSPSGSFWAKAFATPCAESYAGVSASGEYNYVDAIIPQYSKYRFLPGNPQAQFDLANGDDLSFYSEEDLISITAKLCGTFNSTPASTADWQNTPTIDVYQQAGTDFTMFMYLAPPTFYTYNKGITYGA